MTLNFDIMRSHHPPQSCSRSQRRSGVVAINPAQVVDLGPITRKGEWPTSG